MSIIQPTNRLTFHPADCECCQRRRRRRRMQNIIEDLGEHVSECVQLMHENGVIHGDIVLSITPIRDTANASALLAAGMHGVIDRLTDAVTRLEGGAI